MLTCIGLGLLAAAGCGLQDRSATVSDGLPPDLTVRYPELEGRAYEVMKVARVVDGDTFETEEKHKVRLIGVDTPETVKPGSPVESYGKEASAFTKKSLTGKTVYAFKDTGDTDRYGRLLRYVFVEGERDMFNETLITEGYANTMTVPPNVMFAKKFTALEGQAREQNNGLWGETGGSGGNDVSSPDDGDESSVDRAPDGVSQSCSKPEIKGNINSRKEKIYHVPDGRYYDQTKAEEMFCTEEEAKAAGYRKSSH